MVSLLKLLHPHTAIMFSITELDGLLGGAGEIASVDLEKRAPMRFVIILILFRALPKCHRFFPLLSCSFMFKGASNTFMI